MNTFLDFYKTVYTRMEGSIDNWSTTQKGNRNIIVQDGCDRLLQMNRGGKRLRGTLAYLGYYIMCDNDLSEADALAECFELFQTAILVHDDIIDHAESRRGIETIHTAYFREFMERQNSSQNAALEAGASIALCLGDMGFYLAEERLINGYGKNPLLPPLLSYYHKMVLRTIEGELLDVQLSYMERCGMQYAQELPIDSLIYDIYHLKTSCYTTIGPLCSGMLLGGASPSLLRQMEDVATWELLSRFKMTSLEYIAMRRAWAKVLDRTFRNTNKLCYIPLLRIWATPLMSSSGSTMGSRIYRILNCEKYKIFSGLLAH